MSDLISFEAAFLIFRKWAEERPRLRLKTNLPSCRISCEGFIASARDNMVDFRLDTSDFISIHFPEGTTFGLTDPEATGTQISEHIGGSHYVAYGMTLVAGNKQETYIFAELLGDT